MSSGEIDWGTCVLVYAPGRTYAGVYRGGGQGGAGDVCRVRGLQLLIAGSYADTDRGSRLG